MTSDLHAPGSKLCCQLNVKGISDLERYRTRLVTSTGFQCY